MENKCEEIDKLSGKPGGGDGLVYQQHFDNPHILLSQERMGEYERHPQL